MATQKNNTGRDVRQVEEFIKGERWVDARRLIEDMLRQRPDDHWLLARLSTTWYEMGDYEKALELADKALGIEPNCPLALWDRAGALDMLGREEEALSIYSGLVRRGPKSLARDTCGEGEEWAASLVADSLYRAGQVLEDIGQGTRSILLYLGYLRLLDLGVESIYDREEATERLRRLMPKKDRRAGMWKELEKVQPLVTG